MSALNNLSVIIVGAGFGGLAAAIELQVLGAKVKVFEALTNFERQGLSREPIYDSLELHFIDLTYFIQVMLFPCLQAAFAPSKDGARSTTNS